LPAWRRRVSRRRRHRDEDRRQYRGRGVDLPRLPDDLDASGMVGEKADGGDHRRDHDKRDEAAHHRAAPSRATSSASI
jgi:hypothetical protein